MRSKEERRKNMKYGMIIRDLREKMGDTRDELAKKLNISESALGKYERGERKVQLELIENIASIYDVPLTNFFGEEGVLPKELKDKGVKWIRFIHEMEERQLTPEQIKATLEFLDKMGLIKKD
jgi:transcriptional regulator with XRE-family HTH domain